MPVNNVVKVVVHFKALWSDLSFIVLQTCLRSPIPPPHTHNFNL